jgi:hypothetical protein
MVTWPAHKTIWYPAGGYRNPGSGGFGETGAIGYYWYNTGLYKSGSTTTIITANGANPAFGFSIRCLSK